MAQGQPTTSQNIPTTKNTVKKPKMPKVDLSRLAMAKQFDTDEKEYQQAQKDLSDKQLRRGKWKSAGGLLGGAGGGWLGGLVGAGITGALALSGPVGWIVGAAATGIGAGAGSYLGSKKGIEGGERFDKKADTRTVKLDDRPRVSAYSDSRLSEEKRTWNQLEKAQMQKNALITGATAGLDKYLKLRKAGQLAKSGQLAQAGADVGSASVSQGDLAGAQTGPTPWAKTGLEGDLGEYQLNVVPENPSLVSSEVKNMSQELYQHPTVTSWGDQSQTVGAYVPRSSNAIPVNMADTSGFSTNLVGGGMNTGQQSLFNMLKGAGGRGLQSMKNYQPSMPGKGIANWLKGDKQMSGAMLNLLARRGGY